MRGEAWPSLDLAAAEGLVMGASFPELTRHLYNKDFDAEHPAIVEMKAHGVAAADEIGERDIDTRTAIVLSKFTKYASWL